MSKIVVFFQVILLITISLSACSPVSERFVYKVKKGVMYSQKVSPDGWHFAFILHKSESEFYVVVNGEEGKRYQGIKLDSLIFSPDSQRVAYVAESDHKQFIVVNDEEGKRYDVCGDPVFSPDSQRLAYAASDDDGHRISVVDGEEGKRYSIIRDITFSPDSRRFAYTAEHLKWRKGWSVVIDGIEGQNYSRISRKSFVFSPDSQRFAYLAKTGGKQFIVVNGEEGKRYTECGNPIFSPDSRQLAFVASEGGKWFVVVNGKEGKRYDYVRGGKLFYDFGENQYFRERGPVFSPDSLRLAYVAKSDRNQFIVVNDEEGKRYDNCGDPVFSPDSRRVAYGVEDSHDNFVVVKEGDNEKIYEVRKYGFLSIIRDPIFSPDSRNVVYVIGGGGGEYVVVNGKKGPGYDYVFTKGWTQDIFDSSGKIHYFILNFKDAHIFLIKQQLN